jgi:hypothetical protein
VASVQVCAVALAVSTIQLVAGVNPKIVSERLGDTSVAFTLDTYGHVMPTQPAGPAEAAEAILR